MPTHSKIKFQKEIIIVCKNSKVKTKKQEYLDKYSNTHILECNKLGLQVKIGANF